MTESPELLFFFDTALCTQIGCHTEPHVLRECGDSYNNQQQQYGESFQQEG
jgi:hypothetical protein